MRVGKDALLRLPGAASWNASRHGRRTGCMFDADEVYALFSGHVERVRSAGRSLRDIVAIELGPGNSLAQAVLLNLLGARRVVAVDVQRYATPASSPGVYDAIVRQLDERITRHGFPDPLGPEGRAARLAELFPGGGTVFPALGERIDYRVTDGRTIPAESNGADLVYSISVLEHVRDIPLTYREMARVLQPGGLASHLIDLRDHHHPDPVDFLRYPDRLWDAMTGRSAGWTNRLRASEHLAAIARAGLEVVSYEARTVPSPLPRSALAARFRHASDEDLATIGMVLVLRKPEASRATRLDADQGRS